MILYYLERMKKHLHERRGNMHEDTFITVIVFERRVKLLLLTLLNRKLVLP